MSIKILRKLPVYLIVPHYRAYKGLSPQRVCALPAQKKSAESFGALSPLFKGSNQHSFAIKDPSEGSVGVIDSPTNPSRAHGWSAALKYIPVTAGRSTKDP